MKLNKRIIKSIVISLLFGLIVSYAPTKSFSKTKIHLSKTKRNYDMIGLWDKITLKGVSDGAKITWKSSNTKVVKIKDRIKRGTWYKLVGEGKAKISAKYKGKTYSCRITVKESTPEATAKPTSKPTPTPSDDETDNSKYKDAHLNAEDVTIYRCPNWAIPYVHDPEHPLEFQFKVLGTDKQPYWKLDFDKDSGLILTQAGLLKFSDLFLSNKTEATVTAKLSNTMKLTAHVTIVNEVDIAYENKINDFKNRYIYEGMTEYDIAVAVNKYVSHEFDYAKEASWVVMVIKGEGDCMASREGVERLCRELGLKAFGCYDIDDHGECMIRIGDDIYMSITGYAGTKPRGFSFYKMSEEAIQKKRNKYPNCMKFLGFE